MPKKLKRSEQTPSFVCEIPLQVTVRQARTINTRLEAGRQLYNAILGEGLRRLRLTKESKAYQATKKIPKDEVHLNERRAAFSAVRLDHGFTEYQLSQYATQIRKSWIGDHVGAHLAQKIVKRVYQALEKVSFGQAKKVRFKTKSRGLRSLEGKTNEANLRWKGNHLAWGKMILPMVKGIENDPVMAHGLSSKVKYVRLVKRNVRGKDRFYAQLVCEGVPYQKPGRVIGDEKIGLDTGPSTIAEVGNTHASLRLFAEDVVRDHKRIRRLQRKQDRERRANNPDCYDELGRAIKGKHPWKKSHRQIATEAKLRDLYRKEAAHRKTLHGQLANEILAKGKYIYTEKLSYKAFQKRYGKSIGIRAPKLFLSTLRRKAESAGGYMIEFNTRTTALSQTCICGRKEKKSLSERVHTCECGVIAQRDLFSAYLARFVEEDRLQVADAYEYWQSAESLLQMAWEQAHNQLASRGYNVPSSFGKLPESERVI